MIDKSDYGTIFGSTQVAPPDRARAPHVEASRLNLAAVCQKFGWRDEQFELALRFNFPTSMIRTTVARDANEAGGSRFERVWLEDKLDDWARNLMADIRSLRLP